VSINPLLPRLEQRVYMFSGRLSAAEARGRPEKIRLVEDEFIRFVANVATKYGTEFGSYCISEMPKPIRQNRLGRLVVAARRLRNEPRVRQWLDASWEVLMPGVPRPRPRERAE
jgi:hypothetical protein